jgi:hypothetical protein
MKNPMSYCRRCGLKSLVLLLLGTTLLAPAAWSADDALLPALLQRLRQHDTVKVQFTQQKTLRILKKPLQSQGSLLFRRGRGMVWQVTAPVAATYVLNAQGMREVGGDSGMTQSAGSAMPNLLPLFDAIFAGDEATLAQHFDYRATGTPQQWHLSLVPRDELLLRIFNRLELDGRDYIDSIVLFDTRGDQTRIDLQGPQFDSSKLSTDETALLQ